jgi:DNA-directed RNA polymerase subunit M/transcription elongation factor TFIIS
MPFMVFCEECGERFIIQEDEVDNETIRIECQRCGEVNIISVDQIKDLDHDS